MQVVVVTGCGSGIGLVSALTFARRGDRVYAAVRDLDRAGDLKAAIAAEGLAVQVVQMDVADDDSVAKAMAGILAAEGRIDVLVNNAGIGFMGAIESMTDQQWRSMFEVNLYGVVRTVRAVLPGMREQKSGVIINVSSSSARLAGRPFLGPYAASKNAMGMISDALALEVEPFGIRVRVVEPGFFETKIGDNRKRRESELGIATVRPDSPYQALQEATGRHVAKHQAIAKDPQIVADDILAAADEPKPFPIHRVVGDDAIGWVTAAAMMTEEESVTEWKRIRGLM